MTSISGSSYYESEAYSDIESVRILKTGLDDSDISRTLNTARRITTSGFHYDDQSAREGIDIGAILLHRSGTEKELTLRVITRPAETDGL